MDLFKLNPVITHNIQINLGIEGIENQVYYIIYLYKFIEKTFSVQLNTTTERLITAISERGFSEDLIFDAYTITYKFIGEKMDSIVSEMFGVDVYGAMFDIFSLGKKKYAKINWNGSLEGFAYIAPVILKHHFYIPETVPLLQWKEAKLFKQIVPGKIFLYYSILEKR
jgi:hypothetical protein